MKKVLIVEESGLLRDYLVKKIQDAGLEAVPAVNGLEGSLKMRSIYPDLIIIDQMLTRKSSMELLQEKASNPNTQKTPVIYMADKIAQQDLMLVARYGVTKVLNKPLKLDSLLKAVSEALSIHIALDQTPCIIESHFNEEILFIEVAQGLNTEKIMLLKYKIMELLSMYKVKSPRILVMISNMDFDEFTSSKLELLFRTIMDSAQDNPGLIKVLSSAQEVKYALSTNPDFRGIGMVASLDKAMDDLIGMKPDAFAHDTVAREKLLSPTMDDAGSVELRFEKEDTIRKLAMVKNVAVVDDDFIIRTLIRTVFEEVGWQMSEYEDGKAFVDSLNDQSPDLVFLDLSMPVFNGFQV
ncbi:MAG: response regulator, partial [Spirochaetales bacterium]|nr:response regulator [Spirochaetales bacterium]